MKQTITIKDVAREAGVSVATVSYVINNRTDKRISDKTKKKVLQVINLLDYTPNQSAKALATSRNQMVALYLPDEASPLKNAEQSFFLHFLISYFHEKNYDLICLNETYTEKFDHADAIICYDVSSDLFHQIGDCNFIPLIAFDCMIHDPLFFQINSNYQSVIDQAEAYFSGCPYTLVLLDTKNQEKKEYLSTLHTKVRYVRDFSEIQSLKEKNIVVVDQILYQLSAASHHTLYIPAVTREKADALLTCLEYALQRTPIQQHDILI